MQALVVLEARFNKAQNGQIYPANPALTYELFFSRYLDIFEQLVVAARVAPQAPGSVGEAASGARVSFLPIPSFGGVAELVRFLMPIRRILRQAIKESQVYFLRVPSFLASLAWQELRRLNLPYAVEVVGDPADSLQKGAVRHPLRPFIRWLSIRQLRSQVAGAAAAAYVTKYTLQQKYPPTPSAFTTHYSSIELPLDRIRREPRSYSRPAAKLIFVGTLEVPYKGPDVLVQALALTKARGLDLQLTIVGDGRLRPSLQSQVRALGLSSQVLFTGKVPAAQVFELLDQADIFILPSKTEGLPKAMIEAMARALPCIGTTAGGIPELLPPEALAPPGHAEALAAKIQEFALDPERLTTMSARNLREARQYAADFLREKRREFYLTVQKLSEKRFKLKNTLAQDFEKSIFF